MATCWCASVVSRSRSRPCAPGLKRCPPSLASSSSNTAARSRRLVSNPLLIERLCAHDWPFNVRELALLARRLLALHPDAAVLNRGMLSSELREEGAGRRSRPVITFVDNLSRSELRCHRGSGTARLLRIPTFAALVNPPDAGISGTAERRLRYAVRRWSHCGCATAQPSRSRLLRRFRSWT